MQRIRDGSEATATPSGALPADFLDALKWYEDRAPLALARPADWPGPDARSLVIRGLAPPGAPPTPVVADVALADLDGDSRLELIVCDMRHGMVLLGRPYDPAAGLTLVAQVPHPSRAQVVDLDGDGVRDVLVADLGEFLPRDHDKGAVVWLRGLGEGRFAPFAIGGLPRIASVEAADLDADGDLDLLLANGDTFDDSLLKPYHGLAWLERRAPALAPDAFVLHRLADLPGPHGLVATDLDGDGDLDIVASALVAGGAGPDDERLPAVVWLEQTAQRRFERRTLKRGTPRHAALAAGDYDGDGDVDVVTGNMATTGPIESWVDVWENRRAR
jgi:hypothetical protein